MSRRKKSNLNNRFKLNTKLIYDFMESNGFDFNDMASRLGCHEQTVYNFCKDKRVPSKEIFDRVVELVGIGQDDLLLPLVEVRCG